MNGTFKNFDSVFEDIAVPWILLEVCFGKIMKAWTTVFASSRDGVL